MVVLIGELWMMRVSGSGSKVDIFESLQDFVDEVTSLDLPSFLLGDFTDARPAIFPGAQEVLDTVDISGLIMSLFLGSFFTGIEC